MRKSLLRLWPLALLPVAGVAAAAPTPPLQPGLRAACHGECGHARIPDAPNLSGQPYVYPLPALHEYHDGTRKVPAMQAAAGPLNARDVQALARWFAAQSPCPPATPGEP